MKTKAKKLVKLLKENNMYLLHNELFYRNEHADAKIISYNELCQNHVQEE